jgi:hypothetical protein
MFNKIIAIYSENHEKPINIFCGQSPELFDVKADGMYKYNNDFV